MAVTKIKAIRSTVDSAIAYIINPAKTDEKLLVSSFGCSVKTAAKEFDWTRETAKQHGMPDTKILARHVIQSFDVGEVSPELAHEIGKQFADEMLGGKYEYVLATHVDKDHIHNHIIFNAVSFVDHHAYKSYKKIYYDMREISDKICAENGLSVIPPTQGKGMEYKEYSEAQKGTSWKQKLRFAIDKNVVLAKDFDDFLRLMQENGYEVKSGKYISFRAEGQERFTRSKTIGDNYTEERIRKRISGKRGRILPTERKGISLIIDIQNSIKAQQSKVAELRTAYSANSENLKAVEGRLREIQPLIKNLRNYWELKPIQEGYFCAKNKPDYRAKHGTELMIFGAAKDTLKAMLGDKKLPKLKDLENEQRKLNKMKQLLYHEREEIKHQFKQLEAVKRNVDSILGTKDVSNQLEI